MRFSFAARSASALVAAVWLLWGCGASPAPSGVTPPTRPANESPRVVKRCLDTLFRFDRPSCLFELREAEAKAVTDHYVLTLEGERPVKKEHVSSGGRPQEDDNAATYEYEYAGDRLTTVVGYDRYGKLVSRDELSADGRRRTRRDAWGRPRTGKSSASVVERDFDANGLAKSLRCYDADGKPTTNDGGVHEMRWERDARGLVVSESAFDSSGNPSLFNDGYHRMTRQLDSRGRVLSWRYFDREGKPSVVRSGFHSSRHAYDAAGNLIRTEWFGARGEPVSHVMGNHGFDVTRDGRGRAVETAYFETGGRPVVISLGYAVIRSEFDDRDRVTADAYFDADLKPALSHDGYAVRRVTYDARDRDVETRYFGIDGRPLAVHGAWQRVRVEYDSRDRVTQRKYFGLDDRPVMVPAGYATWRGVYDPFDRLVEDRYYGVDGKPVDIGIGFATQLTRYDAKGTIEGRSFEDAAGQRVEVVHFREVVVRFAGGAFAPADIRRTRDEAKLRAEEALRQLRAGATFTSVVLRYSDDARGKPRSFDGDAGFVALAKVRPPLKEVLEKLQIDQVSEVIEDSRGYLIFQRLRPF